MKYSSQITAEKQMFTYALLLFSGTAIMKQSNQPVPEEKVINDIQTGIIQQGNDRK